MHLADRFDNILDLDRAAKHGGWIATFTRPLTGGHLYTWEKNRSYCAISLKLIGLLLASAFILPLCFQDFRRHWHHVFSRKEIKLVFLKVQPSVVNSPLKAQTALISSSLNSHPPALEPSTISSVYSMTKAIPVPTLNLPQHELDEKRGKEEASLVEKMTDRVAALKIAKAWRIYRIKQCRLRDRSVQCQFGVAKGDVHLINVQETWLKKWNDMTIEQFPSSQTETDIEAVLKELIGRKDCRNLRRFASALFAGIFAYEMYTLNEAYVRLVRNFSNTHSSYKCRRLSPEEMGVAIKEVYHSLKPKIVAIDDTRKIFKITDIFTAAHLAPPRYAPSMMISYNEYAKKRKPFSTDPKKEVWIIHGGGFDNICNFISQRTLGYRLELVSGFPQAAGMQVHPCDNVNAISRDRLLFYAKRGAAKSLDRPCIFYAKIKACYLDEAPNSYEAGLRSDRIRDLTDIQMEVLPLNSEMLAYI